MDSDAEVARARLGRTVGGRWLLERVLGTGGMGAVYAARGPDGAVAAVKILHPEMGARREVRERFLREGSAASKIGHPSVVQMLDQGDGEEAFLAMELLEGETLRERVRRHGRLPLVEVLDFAAEVLDVLVAAHARGVVHRDLKPDNLFVTLDTHVRVLDFGLARLLDGVPGQQHTRTGVALGTLAYMAPEQALGRRTEIDGRVDLFALGATMFRVLAGRRVHEAESEAELLMAMASRPAPPLCAVAPDVPAEVAAVVDLALAFSRDARYPDARTMLADVQAVRRGSAPPYATARLTARDERTRPDQPTQSQRTQPLEVKPPVSQRTIPLAQYVAAQAAPAAPVTRTEPLAVAPAAFPGASGPPPVGQTPPPLAVPSAPPIPRTQVLPAAIASTAPFAVAAPGSRKRLALLLGVVGSAGVVVGAVVLYLALSPKSPAVNDSASSALPPPLAAAGATVAPPKTIVASPIPAPSPIPTTAGSASASPLPGGSSVPDGGAAHSWRHSRGRGPHK